MTLRSWLMSLLVSAMAISSLHLWRHREKPSPTPVDDTESDENAPIPTVPRPESRQLTSRRPAQEPTPSGIATIHGRVLGPTGPLENSDGNLSVTAVEDDEEYEATVESDGSFVIQLPAGTYRLDAEFEDGTATLEAVTVAAQEDKEVVLQLAAGVSIRGSLRLPDDFDLDEITLSIEMRLTGEEDWSEAEDVEVDGTDFAITHLETGKHYDLSFTAEGFRPLKLFGILAPVEGLVVVLERPARLRGGFGIARGERCPFGQVIMSDEEYENVQPAPMDRYCRFQPDSLPAADRVRVTVDEADWHFDVLVDIPTHGDPPFLCLKGPCREPGPDELSSLEVTLAGSPSEAFFVSVLVDDLGFRSRSPAGATATVPELPSGEEALVRVWSGTCQSTQQALILQPGPNRVTMPCQVH
jgi:hypothetical protein